MIPIYVISLKRSPERRAAMKTQLDYLNIDFEFFDAVDGKCLDDMQAQLVDNAQALHDWGHELTLGEIGCAWSHISVYQHIVDNGISRCIILEDDAKLHIKFNEIVDDILNNDESEIVFLHHGKAKSWPWFKNVSNGYRLHRYRVPSKNSKRAVFSAAGYMVTLAAAKKMLSIAFPIRMPADVLTGKLQLNGLKASGVEPCCLDVGWFETTIENRVYGEHVKNNF